jgi:hypothetical protein
MVARTMERLQPERAPAKPERSTRPKSEFIKAVARALNSSGAKAVEYVLKAPDEEVGRVFREAVLLSLKEGLAKNDDPPPPEHDGLLERLEAEGLESRRKLVLERELLDSTEFASKLGMSRQAVNKAARANRLFALEVGPKLYYPAFLTRPGVDRRTFEKIIHLLGHLSGWSKWQFFTQPKGSLGAITPIEALKRGQVEQVELAALAFAER